MSPVLGDERRHAPSKQVFEIDYKKKFDDTNMIMMEFAYYYKTLLQAPEEAVSEKSIDKFISLLSKLNQDECEPTDQENGIEKLGSSIECLAKGCTPTPDGLTAEFYQTFCSLLASL